MIMNNLSNPLEELEKIPGSVVSQLIKLPGSIVGGGVKSILGKGNVPGKPKVDPLTGIEIQTPQRVQQLQKREKIRRQSGLAMMRQTMAASQKPLPAEASAKAGQIPQYIAGKPGFNQEKMIKRIEGIETEKRELPPPVAAVKKKFSTGERKHGVGG